MNANPYGTLANFLQSCVDVGWPLAAALAISAIALALYRKDRA